MAEPLRLLVELVVLLLASVTGWPIVLLTLRASARRNSEGAQRAGSRGASGDQNPSVLRGGLWIGFIERFAVAGAILMGQVSLISVIVAVKGLGRFKELGTPEASEKFVLGTLVSMTWAVLVAIVARAVLPI